jgi:hypothetical protein
VDLFFRVMHREQMEIQHSYSQDELARNQELFVANDPMPKLANEFLLKYGLSFDAWIRSSFFASVATTTRESSLFHQRVLSECRFHDISNEQVDAYLRHSSMSSPQIGERFRMLRAGIKPQFHGLIRSAFLAKPLMCFEGDSYLAPHPPLLLRHSGHGLYAAIKQLPSFGDEFGRSVQRYVGKLLASAQTNQLAFGNTEMEALSPGKSCDFLVEFSDTILLVESKATSFVAERLVENAILNDGSTAKIASGIEQLYTTAADLQSGCFDSLGVNRTKPVVGIVATFGDIPFVNSIWYRDNIIRKRAESKLAAPIYPTTGMPEWPLIMSLGTLELFIMNLNSFDTSISALVNEKKSEPYIRTGDWDQFLKRKLNADEGRVKQLAFVKERCQAFWKSVGISAS